MLVSDADKREFWTVAVRAAANYVENDYQEPIHAALRNGARYILILGGERAGKSYTTALVAAEAMYPPLNDDGTFGMEDSRYWIIGPDYEQARAEFQYLYDIFMAIECVAESSMPNSKTQPWMLKTTWGAEVSTKTSNEIAKIASFACDGIILSEAHQQVYEVWLKSLGRVLERRGWVILSGTIENGLPWYPDMYKRWQAPNEDEGRSFSLPTWSNIARYPLGENDPDIIKLRRMTPPDIFMERYAAIPRKPAGAVLPEFEMTKHVRRIEFIPEIPVELAIDPGKNAYAVLFVQRVGDMVHVLDRVYTRGEIAQTVIPQVKAHPYFRYLPKDGPVGVIDIAAKQELATYSQLTLWRDLANVTLTTNYVPQAEGREVLRHFLGDSMLGHDEDGREIWGPRLVFNSCMTNAKSYDGTAADVLAEPELWIWRPQPKTLVRSEPPQPVDANNHAMKALSYYLWHKFGPVGSREDGKRRKAVRRKRQGYWTTK